MGVFQIENKYVDYQKESYNLYLKTINNAVYDMQVLHSNVAGSYFQD